jgi:hypothetical protein
MKIDLPGPEYRRSSPDQLAASSCGGLLSTLLRAFLRISGSKLPWGGVVFMWLKLLNPINILIVAEIVVICY